MVQNNTCSEFQRTKPQYNGAREAEDNKLMSYLPIYSYDSPRAQVEANMAKPRWNYQMGGMTMIRTNRICDVYKSTSQRECNERAQTHLTGLKNHNCRRQAP